MFIKDYYGILHLPPSATLQEIKRSYRQLAQQFHPDKHNNDPYKADQFEQIKEAYEVLTNPRKKNHYLQQRWYNQSMGNKKSGTGPVTPPGILKQCLELNRYVATLDKHRMDREGLGFHISEVLSNDAVEKLKSFNEPEVIKAIIISVLDTIGPLNPNQAEKVFGQLYKLADESDDSKALIAAIMERLIKTEKRRKFQPILILFITIILCILIYLGSR